MARIYPRGGTYYSDLFFPSHPKAGKDGRLRIPLDTDKREANKALERLLEQRDAQKFGRAPKGEASDDFWPRFLEYSSTLNPVSHAHHRRALSNLKALFPVRTPAQVTPGLLQQVQTKWKLAARGLYVRNKDLRSIKMMMRKAEAWGYIEKRDWNSVRLEKEPKGRLLWWTEEELQGQLFPGLNGVWETMGLLTTRAGLRRSEIHWLSWDEGVDFERRRIHIAPVHDEERRVIWSPKDHERRWAPMPKSLHAHLLALSKRRRGRWVVSEDGERPTLGSMTIYFSRLVRKAGLKGSLHTGRHTFGAHLASAGASAKTIKELMGHSSLEQTDIYMHLAPDVQQAAADYLP